MAFIMAGGEKVMPYKSRVPCKYPGCAKLIQPGTMYCEEHTTLRNSQYEKYGRDKDTKRRYGRAWKRIRDKYAAGKLTFMRSVGIAGMTDRGYITYI